MTNVEPRKFNAKVLLCALGLMGVMSGGDAKGYDARPDSMILSDVPNSPPSASPVIVLAQVDRGSQRAANAPHVMGICDVLNLTRSPQADVFPVIDANSFYFRGKGNIDPTTATITVVQQPRHGILEPNPGWDSARYLPNDGYLGDDSFVITVEGNGQKVELRHFLFVTDEVGATENTNPVCKGMPWWKISQDANGNPVLTVMALAVLVTPDTVLTNDSLTSWLNLAQLDGKLADMSNVTVTVAGNGWFVDTTPSLIPTTNPNKWVAKGAIVVSHELVERSNHE